VSGRTILIMAAGTGGHIFPGLAIARELELRGWSVHWMGTASGMENRIVGDAGYPITRINISGVRGKGIAAWFFLPFRILIGFMQSTLAIFRIRPDVVLSLGGYVAFPGGMMAVLWGRPLIVHEPGAVAGITNRLLAAVADRVVVGVGSALAMDKWRTKLVWIASGIPTPRFAMVGKSTAWDRAIEFLGLPAVVKPAREGSTIGLTIVRTPVDFPAAYDLAARYDDLVIAEEYIRGQELTASILFDRERAEVALPLVRIEAPQGNYDYQNKYFTDDTKYFCPAGIRGDLEDEIREAALRSFRVLGCRGWGRADVMLRPDGSYFFLEMNTSPGMTGHSLVPIAAKAAGLGYADLCVRILEDARLDGGRVS